MSSDDTFNPCRFKKVCKTCLKVSVDERPVMCEAIKCVDFKLCPRCKLNRTIRQGDKFCSDCMGKTKTSHDRLLREEVAARLAGGTDGVRSSGGVAVDGNETRIIKASLTAPGTPPPGLTESESLYYKLRWDDYKGYYRDPSAYFICHMIIIEEVNLSHLTDLMIGKHGELGTDISRARAVCINTMKTLKDQLPDKEAEEEMDDNKTISAIYEAFTTERKMKSKGGVSRMLSQEALALAPELLFKLDPRKLLQRCGYKEVDIEEAIEKIAAMPEETKESPERVLEFFGFKLRDEFAQEYESPLIDLEIDNINVHEEEVLDVE